MASSRRVWRILATVAIAALAAPVVPAAIAAEKSDFVRLGYAGFLGPIQMVEASVGLELPLGSGGGSGGGSATPGKYRMGLDIVMSGPLARAVSFNMTAESLGTSGAGGVQPASYSSMTRIYDDAQAMRLTYGPGGAVDISAEPPTVEARVARERGLAQGTLDPLSAIVALVDGVIRTGQCGGRVAVFDGTRRFDLEASPAGTAEVTKIGMSLYEGPATECAVKPVFLDGFRQADLDAGLYPDSATIWIAAVVADAPPVPVRVIGQSALGTLRLDLVEAWAMEGGCPGQMASC
jgi:hypothetical protein